MNEITTTLLLALDDEAEALEPHALDAGAPPCAPTVDPTAQAPATGPRPPVVSALLDRGRIMLNPSVVRRLRESRRLSQQDLADDCWRRNFRVSIATIKRVETGHPVRFRIARELARYFDVPF